MAEVAIYARRRRRRPRRRGLRAIPLAMLTMKKETRAFHNFYACFFLLHV